MAQSDQTGHPTVTAGKAITDLLSAPLGPDWTVEGLAEQLLSAIAAQRPDEAEELTFEADATTDRQTSRLLRPLLACLATKSAAEAGTPVNLYGGHVCFKRPGPNGPVWILGEFENRPGSARVTLRRSSSPHDNNPLGAIELTGPIRAAVRNAAAMIAASDDPVRTLTLFQQSLLAALEIVQQSASRALDGSRAGNFPGSGTENQAEPGAAAARPRE